MELSPGKWEVLGNWLGDKCNWEEVLLTLTYLLSYRVIALEYSNFGTAKLKIMTSSLLLFSFSEHLSINWAKKSKSA